MIALQRMDFSTFEGLKLVNPLTSSSSQTLISFAALKEKYPNKRHPYTL